MRNHIVMIIITKIICINARTLKAVINRKTWPQCSHIPKHRTLEYSIWPGAVCPIDMIEKIKI